MKTYKKNSNYLKITLLIIWLSFIPSKAISAEKITLFKNILSRSITVEELEKFSKTGKTSGLLKKIIQDQICQNSSLLPKLR